MGLEGLPAEGSEPGQVIGVVDVVANSDNLMETLNLNTHHLQDTKESEYLLIPQFLPSSETETHARVMGLEKKTIIFKECRSYSDSALLLLSHSLRTPLAGQSFLSHRVDPRNMHP